MSKVEQGKKCKWRIFSAESRSVGDSGWHGGGVRGRLQLLPLLAAHALLVLVHIDDVLVSRIGLSEGI